MGLTSVDMVKHQETHPGLDVDGCFGCKIASVAISSAAMPQRKSHSHGINQTEARWDRDMAAYKRLRNDGLQPRKIDGSAEVESKAKESWQVETGII